MIDGTRTRNLPAHNRTLCLLATTTKIWSTGLESNQQSMRLQLMPLAIWVPVRGRRGRNRTLTDWVGASPTMPLSYSPKCMSIYFTLCNNSHIALQPISPTRHHDTIMVYKNNQELCFLTRIIALIIYFDV